jgi:hypothetical protein
MHKVAGVKAARTAPRRGRASRGLVVGWLLLAPVAVAQPVTLQATEGRILDQVVAVIESQVLTLSELDFEARVTLVLQGGVGSGRAPPGRRDAQESAGADHQPALAGDGGGPLQAFAADRSEVEARLRAFRERFAGEPELLGFLAPAGCGPGAAHGSAGAERASRAHPGQPRAAALAGERGGPAALLPGARRRAGGPYEAVRESLRKKLVRERYTELAAAEFAQMRAHARVRRVAPFARGEGRP